MFYLFLFEVSLLHKIWILFCVCLFLIECSNAPYSKKEISENTYFTSFSEEPKFFDPARAYSSNEYDFMHLIYEPLLQYHYVRRPYVLEPLTATNLPIPIKNTAGYVEYTIEIKKGIFYTPHPAFAKNENSLNLWHLSDKENFPDVDSPIEMFPQSTKELTVDDYIYQIKRLANPLLECPIFPILSRYIHGFSDLRHQIQQALDKHVGKKNPYYHYVDLRKFSFKGIKKIDRYRFKLILKKPYPQISYWLALPFFSPIPWEVDRFYRQPAAQKLNFSLNRFPIGTGPFFLSKNDPQYRIELKKNIDYDTMYFSPEKGLSDSDLSSIKNSNNRLPFLDKIVFSFEKEYTPRWLKFLQGYYDSSGISSEVFDSALEFKNGSFVLGQDLTKKGIHFSSITKQLLYYYAFNMLDPIVGGYSEEQQKLRRAISIVISSEEYIQLFLNGRGEPAMSPLPLDIFGYDTKDYNKYVYTKDASVIRRRSLKEAQDLLKEAGYLNGKNKDGKPLVLSIDGVSQGPQTKSIYDFLIRQLKQLSIEVHLRMTDYRQFQEKIHNANFQFVHLGWGADYPDPENFLGLLYGPNGTLRFQGVNSSNYQNEQFDRLFKKMQNLENTPERLQYIKQMIEIVRRDTPWVFHFIPINYRLSHSWLQNVRSMTIGNNALKYYQMDSKKRYSKQLKWNAISSIFINVTLVCSSIIFLIIFGYFFTRAIKKRYK